MTKDQWDKILLSCPLDVHGSTIAATIEALHTQRRCLVNHVLGVQRYNIGELLQQQSIFDGQTQQDIFNDESTKDSTGSVDGSGYNQSPGFKALDSQLGLLKRDMGK